MHGAGVFGAGGGSRCFGFERHAALGARAGLTFMNLGTHRADVAVRRRGWLERSKRYLDNIWSRRCKGVEIFPRIGLEFFDAAFATEIIGLAGVIDVVLGGFRIYSHAAHWIF